MHDDDQQGVSSRPGAAKPAAPEHPPPPHDAGTDWTVERTRVAVGRNINVSGKLIFHEPVRIEGSFRGEVRSEKLVVIAEAAMIEGKVFTPRLVVMGELRGDATGCERVMIGPRARVIGNIETRSLEIRQGAWIDGHVRTIGLKQQEKKND